MKKTIYILSVTALSILLHSCGSKPQTVRIPAGAYPPDTLKTAEQIKTAPQVMTYSESIAPLPEPQTVEIIIKEKEIPSKDFFEASFLELEKMLQGIAEPDFEKAIFLSENPYHGNRYTFEDFQETIDAHTEWISMLIAANDGSDTMSFDAQVNSKGRFHLDDLRYLPEEKRILYKNALTNWAIFTYITDTTAIIPVYHLPFAYATHDPFGRKDWTSSQVLGMLISDKQEGNCFALTALYKILSDRLNSDTRLCTAPQHIYIQHRDPKGDYYNVELATAGHPGDGTIQTLTHTTPEAVQSGIALRRYDERQSIGLCVINLAKSYEHTFDSKDDDFLLRCAELVLQYDSLNLNALLLKQQVLDAKVRDYATANNINDIKKLRTLPEISKTFLALEKHLAHLSHLGYRQMPYDMQEIIMTGNYPEHFEDKNPSPFASIQPQEEHRRQYQSMYKGIFPEAFEKKVSESYGHFTLSTTTQTISAMDISAQTGFLIDPVAFAYDFGARIYDARVGRFLSVDPLVDKYPHWSPYSGFANNPILYVDKDGREPNKAQVVGLSTFIQTLKENEIVDDLIGFDGIWQGTQSNPQIGYIMDNFADKRYLYSERWGWLDMKHFAAAAEFTDRWYLTAGKVLEELYKHEEGGEADSYFQYEDLVSNLLGVYFEKYLESEDAKNLSLPDALNNYLTSLGFVDNPMDVKPQNNILPENVHKQSDNTPNKTYVPRYTTKPRDQKIDKDIEGFLKEKTNSKMSTQEKKKKQ